KGLKVATGTIVDTTIINTPSSTKNIKKARDPEMHQTKKGNQWYFGMKEHFGVDSRSKLIHAVVATPGPDFIPTYFHRRSWGMPCSVSNFRTMALARSSAKHARGTAAGSPAVSSWRLGYRCEITVACRRRHSAG